MQYKKGKYKIALREFYTNAKNAKKRSKVNERRA
jgi:hypothetical protein